MKWSFLLFVGVLLRQSSGIARRAPGTNAGLVAEYYAPRGQRRRRSLLSSHPSPCQCDEICVQNLGGNHAISTTLGQACTIGMDDNSNEERKKTNAEQFLTVVAKCQQHMTHGSYSHARNIIDYVGVLWMKGKGTTPDDEMKFPTVPSDFYVTYKRFPSVRGSSCVVGTQCTNYQTVRARMSDLSADVIEVQIPNSMRDPAGGSTFDVQVVLFGNRINPFTNVSNVTLHSRMLRVNARTAATQQMTLEAASIRNYELDSLSSPVSIQMRTCTDCAIDKEATMNKTTGTYFSNVCGTFRHSIDMDTVTRGIH